MADSNGMTLKERREEEKKRIIGTSGKNPIYAAQYKFLARKRQLRVWLEKDKYERFKKAVRKNDTSIYRLISEFVDDYLEKNEE